MERRIILCVIVLFCSGILFAMNYYVDATNGNDSNDGTSPSTAWETTSKVSDTSFSPGDSILFKRGEVWRGGFSLNSSGTSGSPIVYGAYGEGDKPLLLGSVNFNNTNNWTPLGSDQWATTGTTFPVDIGFILLGEESPWNVGLKRWSQGDVDAEKEYWYDGNNDRVVLYCTQNPALEYPSIEIARTTALYQHFINGNTDHLRIENLAIKYVSTHGICLNNGCVDVEIRNCDIFYGGGMYLSGETIRYGNGIDLWVNAEDILIDGCRIGQFYDSGITVEGQSQVADVSDISVTKNIFWGSDLANMEFAYGNSSSTLENIRFEDNISIAGGRGWSHLQRTDTNVGWDLATWVGNVGSWDGFYVKNNVYYEARMFSLYHRFQTGISNFVMDSNYYYKSVGVLIDDHQDQYTMTTFSDYQNDKGRDINSSTGDRAEAQKVAREKVLCEDLFFVNTLFQHTDSIMIGNAPVVFDLSSPADGASVSSPVTLTWGTSTGSTSTLDHYEVWIDCEKVANVPAGATSYQASSLTNGEHNWFLIAVCQDSLYWRQSTSNRTFTVYGGIPTYALTVVSGTGTGNYKEDDVVDISPDAVTGKTFNQWIGDTQYLNSSVTIASNSVTMPDTAVSVTATYNNIQYTLTVENGTGDGSDYICGQVVNIASETAPAGQQFNQWTGDVAYIANKYDSITTVTMPADNITVTAIFKDISSGGDLSPLFNWNLEDNNILLDEGSAMQDLTDHGSVTTGGTEPDPPGYGNVGAVFDGVAKGLVITNEEYGDRALNGMDTDGTIYVAYRATTAAGMFIWSKYQSVDGSRQIALYNNWGQQQFWFGKDNGNDVHQVFGDKYFDAETDLVLGVSLNVSTKEYTFLVWDVANEEYYTITDTDEPLDGTYNTGEADMVIGGTTNLTHAGMQGVIYWVRVYDETHTLEEMKEIIENNATGISPEANLSSNSGISVYPNPAEDILTIDANSRAEGMPQIEIYNLTGEKVFHASQDIAFPYQVDISSFNTGMYMIKVSNGDKLRTVKFIKIAGDKRQVSNSGNR